LFSNSGIIRAPDLVGGSCFPRFKGEKRVGWMLGSRGRPDARSASLPPHLGFAAL